MLPVTVRVNEGPPKGTVLGDTDATTGATGAEIAKADVAWPPPGLGLDTMSCTVPVLANAAEEMDVVNTEELTKMTGCKTPFHVSVDADMKFEPLIVSVKPAVPAAAAEGETDEILGAGFGGGGEVLPPPLHEQSKIARNRGRLAPGSRRNRRLFMAHLSGPECLLVKMFVIRSVTRRG